MAKLQRTMTFNNAEICMDTAELIEYSKDGDPIGRFPLREIFQQWDGVTGISLTIKRTNEVFSSNDEGAQEVGYANDNY